MQFLVSLKIIPANRFWIDAFYVDKNGCGVFVIAAFEVFVLCEFFIAQNLVCIYSYASQMEHFTVEVALFFGVFFFE